MKKEKIEKIINWTIFPIEFIISIIFAIYALKLYCIKSYEGYWNIKSFVITLISGIIILSIIIYEIRKNKDKIEKIFMSIIIPIGMLYCIFMIPSQIPDEVSHLWRAYEITEGKFISDIDNQTKVPNDLEFKIKPYVEKYNQMYEQINTSTDYENEVEVNNTARTYPGILYIFSAIGLQIGKILNLNIIISAYLAKLMNYIVFLVFAYYSVKIIPFGKFPLIAVFFMPMMLHQGTSVSADSMINSISIFYIAYCTKLIFKNDKISKLDGVVVITLSCLIGVSKYVYLPLIGIPLMLVFSKNISKKYKITLLSLIVVLSTIVTIGYFAFSNMYDNPHQLYLDENKVNTANQVNNIIQNPLKYIKVINNTLDQNGEEYIYETIGYRLGWLTITPDKLLITYFIIALILSCFIEKNEVSFSRKQKIYLWLIIIAIIILVLTGLYLTWTTVGKDIIDGVQGRYFIPIILLMLLTFSMKNNYIKFKNIEYIFPIILAILNMPIIHTVIKFFV